jgi:hypothetical protein
MKNLKMRSKILIMCLSVIAMSLIVVSCKKTKVRKGVEGTWNIESLTANGEAYPGTIEGTYTFGNCSSSANRKGECIVTTDITFTLNGGTNTETSTFPYRVLKKGERILMDDAEAQVEVTDNTLRLEFNEAGEQTIITFTK